MNDQHGTEVRDGMRIEWHLSTPGGRCPRMDLAREMIYKSALAGLDRDPACRPRTDFRTQPVLHGPQSGYRPQLLVS